MTQTTAASSTTIAATTRSGLRSLYLIRVAFSVIWVVLVFATSRSLVSADAPTATAAVLLVIYPLWDAVATVLEQRMVGNSVMSRVGTVNIALGILAGIAMIVAVFSTIARTLLVFGIWALLSGAVQLAVAVRRRAALGAQWPMMISGGISVLAGVNFAAMSRSSTSDLSGVAGYSAFGAFWFVVAVIALHRSAHSGRTDAHS